VIGIIGRASITDIIYVWKKESTEDPSEYKSDRYSERPDWVASLIMFVTEKIETKTETKEREELNTILYIVLFDSSFFILFKIDILRFELGSTVLNN
jgi:hypothetical protein